MKLLYLSRMAEADAQTADRLSRIAPQLTITTVATATEALVEIRRSGGFHALLTSPSIAHNETLAIIANLRDRQVPIAIVPVVTAAQQDFLATAIAGGADDVLVLSGESVMQPTETLTRIRQSPHLFPPDGRLRVLYAGSDPAVWRLLEQMPFVRPERATCAPDGGCAVRVPASPEGSLRCDAVVIDEKPDEAHPLQVVKSVKAQASDLPVIVLSSPGAGDLSTAAFNLGADDAVVKSGACGYRLVATLRRVHQRLELASQNAVLKDREARLRRIVETMPDGLAVIAADGSVLAINLSGLALIGAERPREIVGRDLCMLVVPDQRAEVRGRLEQIAAGHNGVIYFDLEGLDQQAHRVELRGVPLERDSRGGRSVIAALRTPTVEPPAEDEDESTENPTGLAAITVSDGGRRRPGRGRR
jgi:PAS domain S-box-containing protein